MYGKKRLHFKQKIMKPSTIANLYLLLVTAMWGMTFPLIHNAVAQVDPFLFVFIRFALGAALLLPLVWGALKGSHWRFICGSMVLGIINSGAYLAQTIGLQTIDASRAAFLTGLCVVLIPLLTPFFKLGRPNLLDFICSFICLAGLYILTGADLHAITRGDEWVLLAAILFAITISYLQYLSLKHKNHRALAFFLILFTAPLPMFFFWHANFHALLLPSVLVGVLFCTICATSLALYLQTKYQKFTTAPKAAIIYSLEPVFASIFGFLLNGEVITWHTVVGGIVMLFSLMLPALWQLLNNTRM